MSIDRREFLRGGLAATGLVAAGELLGSSFAVADTPKGLATPVEATVGQFPAQAAANLPTTTQPGERRGDMLYRALGATGQQVSLLGLGGYHIGSAASEKEAIRLVRTAVDRGVTFMDNSWDYHDGKSEVWMGKALQDGYRQKVFLMTKEDGRTRQATAKQIDESLKRFQVDHIDLMQIHEVIRMEDPDRVFADDGAIHALIEARKAGKIRYIGFTGHKDPYVHLRMLATARANNFRFDAVQMPLNVMDAHFRSFAHEVVPGLVRENIGVLGMKSMGSGAIITANVVTPTQCLHYAMTLPTSVVINGISNMELLEQALNAVKTFKPMSREQLAVLLEQTAQAAASGRYEGFKTSTKFDSTAIHPEWLG